jgi:ABC-type phosphate/phosphonate transport system substrate-binding protein
MLTSLLQAASMGYLVHPKWKAHHQMTSTDNLRSATSPFITCGMYAFTDDLKLAWQAFFRLFHGLADDNNDIDDTLDLTLRFDTDLRTLRDDRLFMGHTCGYPLMKNLQDKLSPICVPVFNVDVCDGIYYASTFITSVNSQIQSLQDCYQGVAAFNGRDSNSGMNVFRHALAPLAQEIGKWKPFFSRLVESGSHRQSLIEVTEGRVDVAAIDSVSLALIADAWPELAAQIKVIGYSVKTCGLPFVMPISRLKMTDSKQLTLLLNEALTILPDKHRHCLRLVEFVDVELSQYQSILDLEQQAVEMAYPHIL